MKDFLFDDKTLVILAVTILGLAITFSEPISPDKVNILTGIFAGLFGIAVGRTSK